MMQVVYTRAVSAGAAWMTMAVVAVAAIVGGAAAARAAQPPKQPDLLGSALEGPMKGVEDIVFAVRPFGTDGH